MLHHCDDGAVLTAEDARKVERFEDRPTQIARRHHLERARAEHVEFLARYGISPPPRIVIVPLPPEPPRPPRRRRPKLAPC